MTQKGVYLTQRDPTFIDTSKIQIYIDSLDKKIEGAKWKQNLVLTYNYMPLEMAKQKIAEEKQMYLKRLSKLQSKLKVQTKNQQTEEQVQLFRDFGDKLLSRIKEIQERMDSLKMDMTILRASVQQKKQSLTNLLRQNVHLNKMLIQQHNKILYTEQPIRQKQSTISSRSQQFPLRTLRAISQIQKDTPKSTKYSYSSSTNWRKNSDLFQQCVEATIKSLKSMNASEDVQAGIYLQIMNRKMPIKAATFSLKSKACDVLMDRYKDLKNRKPKQNDDFMMSQNTFISLNWKQIMGIILVKDRNATKLRQLLKFSQDQN